MYALLKKLQSSLERTQKHPYDVAAEWSKQQDAQNCNREWDQNHQIQSRDWQTNDAGQSSLLSPTTEPSKR